jgi:AcrR family transcriptional regulator
MPDPGPRERLLTAARDLTYRHGTAVGVDAILREANVARRSLYQHFGGKDGLLAEVLRCSAAADESQYRAGLDLGGSQPRERILALFDGLDTVVSAPQFHGCRYTAAGLNLDDPQHPAHVEILAHKARVRALLLAELEAAGHRDPEQAATQLMVLIEGVMSAALTHPQTRPGKAARALVALVLDN